MEVRADHNQQDNSECARYPALARLRPRYAGERHANGSEEDGIRSTDEVQQRHQRQTRGRSAEQVRSIKLRDTGRVSREDHRKQKARHKERHSRDEIKQRQAPEVRPVQAERHRAVQHNLEHHKNQHCIRRA